jgi:peptidoglycan biosynthesis protein MviN/MurJ (putative lipid II flippase)
MIANLFNVFVGLALVYSAVLRPSLIGARPALLFAAAACIFVAAWLARRSDTHPWQNNINMLLAVALIAMTALRFAHIPLAAFWSQFSVGTTVAVLALWAALYRRTESPP